MSITIGLQRDEDGLLVCRSCSEGAKALNAELHCEDCFRDAMDEAYDGGYKSWPQSTPFVARYLAARP